MPTARELLRVVHHLRRRPDHHATLEELAARAGWSRFHLHRAFHGLLGETPKRYTLRLSLERAATRLISTGDSILSIALDAGFSSHEVFTRAFRRRFGRTPYAYRRALAHTPAATRERHCAIVGASGPCIGLFHVSTSSQARRTLMPTLSIARCELPAQPALVVRSQIGRHELAKTIGEGLGKTFPYAQKAGIAIAGRPFARYLSSGPGLITVEVGMPVAVAAAGAGDVEAVTLPAGPAALAVHAGPYDQLSETYVAIERWFEANGCRRNGAPWESYITDPADLPNPADWRTEMYWPMAEQAGDR